jgi:hypothetical protein
MKSLISPTKSKSGNIAFIDRAWWDAHPDATNEAIDLATWDGIHIERRNAEPGTSPREMLIRDVDEYVVYPNTLGALAPGTAAVRAVQTVRTQRVDILRAT